MAAPTLSPQRHDQDNPGQHHEDDLFKHFEDQYHNPTGSSVGENANIDRAESSLRGDLNNAENSAAAGASAARTRNANPAAREQTPNYYYKPRMGQAKATAAKEIKAAKARSATYRKKGGRSRGLLIGFGAGGGLLSIIAGFSALLPLKLPGIMDTLIGDAGKRVEKVIERRAERVFIQYILRGSTAAVKTGNVIVTGNPIGDLFANIRTSNFEKALLENRGLSIEPTENGQGVRLKYEGDYIWAQKDFSNGTIKNSNEIFKLLDEGKTLTRADLRAIVRTEIPAWRFWKRAKFVNWLRIKYNIPRWGTREQQATEKDEDYEKAVKKEHIQRVETPNLHNLTDFVDCAAEAGDCIDRTDEGGKMTEQANKAIAEAAEELSQEGSQKASSTVSRLVISKLTSSSVGAAIPYLGWIDIGARIAHGVGQIIEDELLQKKHAEYIKRSSAVLGATYAGYAGQTKAGDMQPSIVGMFANNFDGWEDSASYGIIQSAALGGPVTGAMLEPMEKANESIEPNEFANIGKTLFGTVGWVGRLPLELWYHTVSQLFDAVGALAGDAVGWIVEHTPAKALLAQLGPVMADIFEGIMKFVGMHVDPLAVGSRLALFIHQGFLGAFNDKAKEDGMRKLSEAQGSVMDQQIKQDRIADLKDQPLYERVFSLDNSNSLAATLVTTMPSSVMDNPAGTLASASARLVSNAPSNLARATTVNVSAITAADTTSESLFALNMYGGLESDLSADLDAGVAETNKQCPENSDNSFNHCRVDRSVVESMNCVFVKCADMYASQQAGDPLFAYGAEGPRYGPDAVESKPKYGAVALDWTKIGGMVAAMLPIGALEISRRKLA